MSKVEPIDLIYSLVGYPNETEWLEFKENFDDPESLGRDISALANASAYHGRDMAYKIWGVENDTHLLVGTCFNPLSKKAKGNQDLQIWLRTRLSPNANYEFEQIDFSDKSFVVLKICSASDKPVYFDKAAYIRIGSSTSRLEPGSARESELWHRLQRSGFELRAATENLEAAELPSLLNIEEYFNLLDLKPPTTLEASIIPLCEQGILKLQDNESYTVTNLGALLLAKKLSAFSGLRKRSLRVIRFAGKGNFEILEDKTFDEGYATALQKAEEYIMTITPSKEYVKGAFRKVRNSFPQRAVRELLSNTVIHQDLTVASSGPFVGIYDNRIEFSNPGSSLIPLDRILNAQPKTRNNELVGQLRQMDLCEEGGTGWDLTVEACEAFHITAPKIESPDDTGTKVTLRKDDTYDRMTKKERIDALYWHTCLMYAQGNSMSNQSLRKRFGLENEKKNLVAMSRLIRECCNSTLIKEEDRDAGAKYKRYIPAWA